MDKIQILREKGYTYLGHVTKRCNVNQIYAQYLKNSNQKLGTLYDRYLERVQVDGVYSKTTLTFETPFSIPNPADYPGLFFHLLHSSIDELQEKYKEYDNSVLLLFPLELLVQNNWHFKIVDKNGMIDYDTYFPENMGEIPSYQELKNYYESVQGYYLGNEVVFHDGIPLSNCIHICGKDIDSIQIEHQLVLDMDRKPNYVFYSDRRYDGTKVPYYHLDHRNEYTTSNEFYINFIRKHLPDQYKYLCEDVCSKEELENRIFETKVEEYDLFTYLYIYRK